MPLCGGRTEVRDADPETQQVVDKVRQQAESKVNKSFKEFKAVKVSTQVVAGINYFVKVHVGGEEYMHLKIFVPLPCHGTDPQLDGFQYPKTKEDEL